MRPDMLEMTMTDGDREGWGPSESSEEAWRRGRKARVVK